MNELTYNYATYLVTLADGTVTKESYDNILNVALSLNSEENLFFQIIDSFAQHDNEVATILANIKNEYNLVGLSKVFGNFNKWQDFIRFCLEKAQEGIEASEIGLQAIEYVDNNSDIDEAIKYAVYTKSLNFLITPSFFSDRLGILRKIVNYVEVNKDKEYKGATAMDHLLSKYLFR